MPDRHSVRKTYKRDRAGQPDRPVHPKLQVYIRPDQESWIIEECTRRGTPKFGRNAGASQILREAIDLLIEYAQHKDFLRGKASSVRGAAPVGGPDARSPESGAPGQQSSGSSGRA